MEKKIFHLLKNRFIRRKPEDRNKLGYHAAVFNGDEPGTKYLKKRPKANPTRTVKK